MTNCEACAYYSYDEDYECYICEMDLDEDEMLKFLSSTFDACPYYRSCLLYTSPSPRDRG